MSWWIRNLLLSSAILILLLGTVCLSAAPTNEVKTNGSLVLSNDSRFIVDDEMYEKASGKQVDQFLKEGKLVDYSYLAKHVPLLHDPQRLAPVETNFMPPPDLADRLRKSTAAIGLRYLEPHKKKWNYMIAATAFAVAPEILSTSLHVMTIDPEMMREAQAVAITDDGEVYPITEIVATSNRGDTCLVRAPGLTLPLLPLRGGVRPGEPVWCMSHPDGFTYMFTSGEVARISRERYDEKIPPGLHVEVTAEYCPGSSGAAVTDAAGNVVAQVSSINNYDGFISSDHKSVNGIVSARTCTAAEEILALTTSGTNDAIPLPSPDPLKKHRLPKPR